MTRDEDGSITLWMVTASFAMMMLVGLAVDLGGQVHAQQRAQNVAGQAARAGGQEVQAAPALQGRYVAINAAAARNAAQDYLSTAGVNGTVSVTDGTTITVSVTDTYRPKFLGIVGLGGLPVTGEASARLIRTVAGSEQ
jgi:Flp pilus assembly protein TadG